MTKKEKQGRRKRELVTEVNLTRCAVFLARESLFWRLP
jgi:hypothetical protein